MLIHAMDTLSQDLSFKAIGGRLLDVSSEIFGTIQHRNMVQMLPGAVDHSDFSVLILAMSHKPS